MGTTFNKPPETRCAARRAAQVSAPRFCRSSSSDCLREELVGTDVVGRGEGEAAVRVDERGTIAGMVVAIVGTLGPATWAAASKTTTALHAE